MARLGVVTGTRAVTMTTAIAITMTMTVVIAMGSTILVCSIGSCGEDGQKE